MLLIRTYRDAFHGLNRQTWLLSLVIFINRCGTMAIPFMSIYVTEQLHRSIADAGLIITLFGFGSIAGSLFGGYLTDKLGFRLTQIITAALGGLLFIGFGLVHNFWVYAPYVPAPASSQKPSGPPTTQPSPPMQPKAPSPAPTRSIASRPTSVLGLAVHWVASSLPLIINGSSGVKEGVISLAAFSSYCSYQRQIPPPQLSSPPLTHQPLRPNNHPSLPISRSSVSLSWQRSTQPASSSYSALSPSIGKNNGKSANQP